MNVLQTLQNTVHPHKQTWQNKYSVDASMANITITTPKRTCIPRTFYWDLTQPHSYPDVFALVIDLSFEGDGHITIYPSGRNTDEKLSNNGSIKHIDQEEMPTIFTRSVFPRHFGEDNPVLNYLSMMGISTGNFLWILIPLRQKVLNGEVPL